MTTVFLRNTNQSRFRDILVECHKAFMNKDDRYQKLIPDMMDVMRKIPENKSKPNNHKPGKVEENNKKKESSASSYATKSKDYGKEMMNTFRIFCAEIKNMFFQNVPLRGRKLRVNAIHSNISKKVTHSK